MLQVAANLLCALTRSGATTKATARYNAHCNMLKQGSIVTASVELYR